MLLEVLPLDDAARPGLLHARHEGVDQRVVLGAAQPRLPVPDVERIGEEIRVVGADVKADRKGEAGIDAAGARVERQLADRDGHPAGAEVAQPEDAFVVGHHDEPDVGVRAVAQDLGDPIAIMRRDPGAARPPEDVAELLAGAPDGRGVHDRQQLLQVLGQDPIEERRVPVLERGKADVLLERIVLPAQPLQLERDLLLDGHDVVRQQAAQAERVALVRREGEVLGEQPVGEERGAAERDLRRASGGDRVVRRRQRAHRASRIRNGTWPPFEPPRGCGAGDGDRTRDMQLGRLPLCQLSYSRVDDLPRLVRETISHLARCLQPGGLAPDAQDSSERSRPWISR